MRNNAYNGRISIARTRNPKKADRMPDAFESGSDSGRCQRHTHGRPRKEHRFRDVDRLGANVLTTTRR
jgi:hypothetical protein